MLRADGSTQECSYGVLSIIKIMNSATMGVSLLPSVC